MTPQKSTNRRGSLVLTFFALPFLGIGLFMGSLLVTSLWDWTVMQSWQQVPVAIEQLELVRSRGETTTSEVQARYRYEWQGQIYTAKRVAINSGSDNLGSFWPDLYRRLRPSLNGVDYPGFIDPEQPGCAVLVRELHWGRLGLYLIFLLTFGGFGTGMLWFSRFGSRKQREQQNLQQPYPDQPWRQRKDWATNQIKPGSGPLLIFSTVFALFWNLVSAPTWFFIPELLAKRDLKLLLVALFPATGIGLAVWALRSLVRWRRFGRARLQLTTLPAQIGGTFAAELSTFTDLRPQGGFSVTLNCVHKRTSGRGKNRNTHETILAQEQQTISLQQLRRGVGGTVIPMRLPIPHAGKPWDDSNPSDQVLWRLEVHADIPGIDYLTEFEVPVFGHAAAAPSEEAPPASDDTPHLQELAHAEKLRFASTPDQALRVTSPMLRRPAAALSLTLFTAIWSGFTTFLTLQMLRQPLPYESVYYLLAGAVIALGICLLFWRWRLSKQSVASHQGGFRPGKVDMFLISAGFVLLVFFGGATMLFALVFGLFNLIFIALTLDLWFTRIEMEINTQGLLRRAGLFGLGRTRRWAASEIDSFRVERGMQSGRKLYHSLELRTRDGRRQTLLRQLSGRRNAEKMIALFKRQLQR